MGTLSPPKRCSNNSACARIHETSNDVLAVADNVDSALNEKGGEEGGESRHGGL